MLRLILVLIGQDNDAMSVENGMIQMYLLTIIKHVVIVAEQVTLNNEYGKRRYTSN